MTHHIYLSIYINKLNLRKKLVFLAGFLLIQCTFYPTHCIIKTLSERREHRWSAKSMRRSQKKKGGGLECRQIYQSKAIFAHGHQIGHDRRIKTPKSQAHYFHSMSRCIITCILSFSAFCVWCSPQTIALNKLLTLPPAFLHRFLECRQRDLPQGDAWSAMKHIDELYSPV